MEEYDESDCGDRLEEEVRLRVCSEPEDPTWNSC